MTDPIQLRAEAARARAGTLGTQRAMLPCGEAKRDDVKFKSEFRAETVQRDGRDFYMVEGYASMVERAYEMWDMFGPYDEVVSRSAFDKTLATKPMVVYRFNHAGMPMASTQNGRLELEADSLGLRDLAWLNPQRADVQQLVHAIGDGDVTEQSFMFRITDGVWNDDFDEFRINSVDLDRGDVGPVTYGANPHTLVAARSGELLAAIPDLPPLAAREAYRLLGARPDLVQPAAREPLFPLNDPEFQRLYAIEAAKVAAEERKYAPESEPETPAAMSLRLALAQFEVDDQTFS